MALTEVAGTALALERVSKLIEVAAAATTSLMNINTEILKLNQMIAKAQAEGRELNQADWDQLDGDLASAKADAQAAGQEAFGTGDGTTVPLSSSSPTVGS